MIGDIIKNTNHWLFVTVFLFGIFLIIEDLVIQTNWMAYGIQSVYINGFHFHHWMMGLIIVFLVGMYAIFYKKH